MNRLGNAKNWAQGNYKKVLCVCSAGLLRSPTAAVVLASEPFNYNTRAAGLVEEFALIPVDRVLLEWADEVVCMQPNQGRTLRERLDELGHQGKRVVCLNIEDNFEYRNPDLVSRIRERYLEAVPDAIAD